MSLEVIKDFTTVRVQYSLPPLELSVRIYSLSSDEDRNKVIMELAGSVLGGD